MWSIAVTPFTCAAGAAATASDFVVGMPSRLRTESPDGSPRNVLPCRVGGVDPEGDRWRIRLNGAVPLVAEVTPAAATELHLTDGGDVFAVVKATEIDVYSV